MPDAPAPGSLFSSTTTSAPEPVPRVRSSFARWYAVERPWIPAPTTTYREAVGTVMSMGRRFPALELGRLPARADGLGSVDPRPELRLRELRVPLLQLDPV